MNYYPGEMTAHDPLGPVELLPHPPEQPSYCCGNCNEMYCANELDYPDLCPNCGEHCEEIE